MSCMNLHMLPLQCNNGETQASLYWCLYVRLVCAILPSVVELTVVLAIVLTEGTADERPNLIQTSEPKYSHVPVKRRRV